jgi:hypothetical protein
MQEIADFTGPEAAGIYQAIAGFYDGMTPEKGKRLTDFLQG